MSSIYQQDKYAQATPYYRMVFEKMDELLATVKGASPKGDFYTTSNEVPMRGMKGGVTFECSLRRAAEDIVNGTHRLATDGEIAKYKESVAERARVLQEISENKKNTMVMKTSKEETDRMVSLVSAAVSATLAQTGGKPQQKGA